MCSVKTMCQVPERWLRRLALGKELWVEDAISAPGECPGTEKGQAEVTTTPSPGFVFWALPVSTLWRINKTFRSGLELQLWALSPRWHLTDTFEQKIKGREGSKSHLAPLHRHFIAMWGLEKEEDEGTLGRSSTLRISILNEANRAFVTWLG